jgi:hypothetical protein
MLVTCGLVGLTDPLMLASWPLGSSSFRRSRDETDLTAVGRTALPQVGGLGRRTAAGSPTIATP